MASSTDLSCRVGPDCTHAVVSRSIEAGLVVAVAVERLLHAAAPVRWLRLTAVGGLRLTAVGQWTLSRVVGPPPPRRVVRLLSIRAAKLLAACGD